MMGRLEKLFPSEIFVAQKTHIEIFPEIAPPPPPTQSGKNSHRKSAATRVKNKKEKRCEEEEGSVCSCRCDNLSFCPVDEICPKQ
jgi:hypothetical protein